MKKPIVSLWTEMEKTTLVALSVMAFGSLPMHAANRYFNVANGDWATSGNWTSAAPIAGDVAYIGNGSGSGVATGTAAILTGDNFTVNRVIIGNGAGGSGTLNMTGGTLNAQVASNGAIFVGDAGGTGHLNLSGASSVINTTSGVFIGRGNGSVGSLSVTSGTLLTSTIYAGGANLGTNTGVSSGTLTVSGGAVISSGLLRVANAASGVGDSVTGVVNHSAGLISASSVEVQSANAGNGVYNLSGGELRIGTGGSGGQLRGGGTGTRAFNWSGGTISLGDSSSLVIANSLGTLNLQSGGSGSVFNTTNGNDDSALISVQSTISGNGSLTVRGTGTVDYTRTALSHTGDTTVEGGTLLLSNNAVVSSAKVAVQTGGVLAGTGTISNNLAGSGTVTGAFTVQGDVTGGDFGTIGTLTFTQGLSLEGGGFAFDFLNATQADLVIASSLTLIGGDPIVITVNSLVGSVVQVGDIFTVFQGATSGLGLANFQVNNMSSWAGGFDVLVGADSVQLQAVPEPSVTALAVGGAFLLAFWSIRKRRQAA